MVEDEELLHGYEAVHVGVVHTKKVLLHFVGINFWQSYLDKFSECFLVHATFWILLEEIFTLGSDF